MPLSPGEVRANRDYFAAKLKAEKQKADVVKKVKEKLESFLLLDTRPRDAFEKGHIEGAFCVPFDEIDTLVASLPKDRELVTYCWNHT